MEMGVWFDIGQHDGTINASRGLGSPSLGLGSMSDLVISLVSLMVWSWLCIEDGVDTLVNEGMFCWFHGSV